MRKVAVYDINRPLCFKVKIELGTILSKERINNTKYPNLNASQTYASEGVECDPIFIGDMIFWYTKFIANRGYENIKFYRITPQLMNINCSTDVDCCTTSSDRPSAGYLISAEIYEEYYCRILFDCYGKLHADDEPALFSFANNDSSFANNDSSFANNEESLLAVVNEAITIYADHGRFITKSNGAFIKPSVYTEHYVFINQGDGEITPLTMYTQGDKIEHRELWESIEFIEHYEGPALVYEDLIIRL